MAISTRYSVERTAMGSKGIKYEVYDAFQSAIKPIATFHSHDRLRSLDRELRMAAGALCRSLNELAYVSVVRNQRAPHETL